MWFLLPLWSGKESQWSKWESSFSTLRVVSDTQKEGHFSSEGVAKQNVILTLKINTVNSWLRTWWSRKDIQRLMEGQLDLLDQASTFPVGGADAASLLHLPRRCCVRQSPHSSVGKQSVSASNIWTLVKVAKSVTFCHFCMINVHVNS